MRREALGEPVGQAEGCSSREQSVVLVVGSPGEEEERLRVSQGEEAMQGVANEPAVGVTDAGVLGFHGS